MRKELKIKEVRSGVISWKLDAGVTAQWVWIDLRKSNGQRTSDFLRHHTLEYDISRFASGGAVTATIQLRGSNGLRYKSNPTIVGKKVKDKFSKELLALYEKHFEMHENKRRIHANAEALAIGEQRPLAASEHKEAKDAHMITRNAYSASINNKAFSTGAKKTLLESTKRAKEESEEAFELEEEEKRKIAFELEQKHHGVATVQDDGSGILKLVRQHQREFTREQWWNAFRPLLPKSFYEPRVGKLVPRALDPKYRTVPWNIIEMIIKRCKVNYIKYDPNFFNCNKYAREVWSMFPREFRLNCPVLILDDHAGGEPGTEGAKHAYNAVYGLGENGQLECKLLEPMTDKFVPLENLWKWPYKVSRSVILF